MAPCRSRPPHGPGSLRSSCCAPSLEKVGVFSPEDTDAFLQSTSTVTSQMAADPPSRLSRSVFLQKYGHLRPGTYDILSRRYDEAPDLYFNWSERPEPVRCGPALQHQPAADEGGDRAAAGRAWSADRSGGPVQFPAGRKSNWEQRNSPSRGTCPTSCPCCRTSVRAMGFSRDDLSYCDITTIKELQIAALGPKGSAGPQHRGRARALCGDADAFAAAPDPATGGRLGLQYPAINPNFITRRQVTAEVGDLEQRDALAGCIVCIPMPTPATTGCSPAGSPVLSPPGAGRTRTWPSAPGNWGCPPSSARVRSISRSGRPRIACISTARGNWSRSSHGRQPVIAVTQRIDDYHLTGGSAGTPWIRH